MKTKNTSDQHEAYHLKSSADIDLSQYTAIFARLQRTDDLASFDDDLRREYLKIRRKHIRLHLTQLRRDVQRIFLAAEYIVIHSPTPDPALIRLLYVVPIRFHTAYYLAYIRSFSPIFSLSGKSFTNLLSTVAPIKNAIPRT